MQRQIASKEIRVFVYNLQNTTPDIQGVVGKARAEGIPVVPITETMVPASASFQDWQTRQLTDLRAALRG